MKMALYSLMAAAACIAAEVVSRPGMAADQGLRDVKKIFVDKMPNDLDDYVRAEITKQFKGSLTIVLDKADADATLTGTSTWKKGTASVVAGRYFGLEDTATGAVTLVSKDGKAALWSSEAGDRSIWWGPLKRGGERKVADRLVHNLKRAMTGK